MLSPAAWRLLHQLTLPGETLTYSSGEWWTEIRRWAPITAKQLLWCGVLHSVYKENGDKYEIYELTAEGRKLDENHDYVPELIRILRAGRHSPA